MNEAPGARMRVGLTALTMAEHFRDKEHQDVLLFIDNIFRFTQAGSEVSALLGRMPSAVGRADYEFIYLNDNEVVKARVYSNKELDDAYILKVKSNIENKTQKEVIIENIIDNSITAGIRIEYESTLIDLTIDKKFNQM